MKQPENKDVKMTDSKQIAGLVGPTIMVLTLSEMLNLHIWATNIPPVTYLNGFVMFVAGLLIVRAHNYWVRGWPVLITLTGWILLIVFGLGRMFFPEAHQLTGDVSGAYALIAVFFAIGCFLTFKAYSREESNTAAHEK